MSLKAQDSNYLRPRTWSADDDEKLRDLKAKGYTLLQLAVELHRTKSDVYHRSVFLGINQKTPRGQAAREQALENWMNEATNKAKAAGLPVPKIHQPKRTKNSCDILGLTSAKCHWPAGEPGSVNFFYCGDPTYGNSSWCEFHWLRARGVRTSV